MTTSPPAPVTETHRADDTLTRIAQDDWGDFSPSVYETARVHAWAPDLPGHRIRTEWLLKEQSADGLWGEGPTPYRLLPTLSVVDAFLRALTRHAPSLTDDDSARLTQATDAALTALTKLPSRGTLPDTAAVELLVPLLLTDVNKTLNELAARSSATVRLTAAHRRLGVIHSLAPADEHLLRKLAALPVLPTKLHHCFEALAPHCPPPPLPPAAGGHVLIGASPAATAAWLTVSPAPGGARAALTATGERYGQLFPEAAPLATFERLWVLAALLRAGLVAPTDPVARRLVLPLRRRGGVPGAPGLAPDADDTALMVHVATALGLDTDPHALTPFASDDHFVCYIGEDTGSVSANAHILTALWDTVPDPCSDPAIRATSNWLTRQQLPEGHWTDKWHASPLYATSRVCRALARSHHPDHRSALGRAGRWARDRQRPDGSWGVWQSTLEETAYGIQILRTTSPDDAVPALRKALRWITEHRANQSPHPPLWHDKTLYTPTAIIEAESRATVAEVGDLAEAP
ncbi:prenyltransferase/squalene oxidase repeat-containing protein [Streptomyces sp. NPDC059816]|uniref:prenyltransferase/squalene oxidase repeat-containing protein n=1 Tax=Streptomyces sp. NPDC059816 TaxID=3346960 RepID=UPI0036699579